MTEKCNCGGEYVYSREDTMGFGKFTRSINAQYFSGIYLICDKCKQQPKSGKVVKKITIKDEANIMTKSDFGKKIGCSPQAVDSMINSGRVKVVGFAGKEFVYYDSE